MSLISPNFAVKLIIFPNFGQGPFPKIAGKGPVLILKKAPGVPSKPHYLNTALSNHYTTPTLRNIYFGKKSEQLK